MERWHWGTVPSIMEVSTEQEREELINAWRRNDNQTVSAMVLAFHLRQP